MWAMGYSAVLARGLKVGERRSFAHVCAGGALGLVIGAAVSVLASSTGCVLPDECILVSKPGRDWCAILVGAEMWPIGQPEDAEAVMDVQGAPRGCTCFNDDESQVLYDKAPESYYDILVASIDGAARLKCDSLVPAGYEHNCFEVGVDGPAIETPFSPGFGVCVGDCTYTHDCGDPTPHECEEIVEGGGDEAGEGGDTGTNDFGGALDAPGHVSCAGTDCQIDRGFARSIWDEPSVLLEEHSRLVFDADIARFVFDDVRAGSLAEALGLRDGDVLESVDGVVIDDLDAGLKVYSASTEAPTLEVRIERSGRWIDYTYTFVD